MLLEVLSSLFDEVGLNPVQRRCAARSLVRVLCKLATYRQEVDSGLRKALGMELERELFHWWQQQRTNRDLLMLVWRGVYCFAETGNAEHAEHLTGIHQRDIRYAYAQLNQKDLKEIGKSTLDWNKPGISQQKIMKIMKEVEPTIRHYVYKLRFLKMSDVSLTQLDLMAMLKLEALSLITRYECERSLPHIRNTVLRGLKSYWSETVSYYKRAKRDLMPSHEVEDINGKHFDYENIRQSLTLKTSTGDGDGEIENPALLSKSTNIEKDLETRSVIRLVRNRIPRYGKYLGICVLERKNKRFHKWLRENELRVDTTAAFHRSAKRFCGVTSVDEERAKRLIAGEMGYSLMA